MPHPHDLDAEALVRRVSRELRQTAERVVPQFLEQMPHAYFRDTDEATVRAHLSAVVAARASGIPPQLILKNEEQGTWTFVHQQSYRGLLSGLVEQLPRDRPLVSAKVHTAADGGLVLDVFRFGEASAFDPADPVQAGKLEATLAYAKGLGQAGASDELRAYLAQCSADFVRAASPLRLYETWRLAREVQHGDDFVCALHSQRDPNLARISVATSHFDHRTLFERLVRHLGRAGFDITRAFLDVLQSDGSVPVSSLGFVVADTDNRLSSPETPTWLSLRRAIKRLRWVDDASLNLVEEHPDLGLERAEVLITLTRLVHPLLAVSDPFAFMRDRLFDALRRYRDLSRQIADLFLARFATAHPPGPVDETRRRAIDLRIEDAVDSEPDRRFLERLTSAVAHIRASNFHLEDRLGLALRIDPALFADHWGERPYGVFYVHARGMDGFHVRFSEIAGGGVRALRPPSQEPYVRESERLYQAAYNLAHEQHLKNKDVPEGGAQAVVLLAPDVDLDSGFKTFIDGLLDLLSGPGVSGRLYLDSDENISPSLTEWVTARAGARGYSEAGAFMSSRASAVIDHQVHGITSEGIVVFTEEALRTAGIEPNHERFTIKLTGGPGDDVAGSTIELLHRGFGDRARIVAIADDSGSGWDPDGLDHRELLRLVDAKAPIASFDRTLLGPLGGVLKVEEEGGLRQRNRLPFEVLATVFIAADGRPQTIHGGNWTAFLADGQPSSRVIVEGAHRFVTPEARRHLSEAGVIVVNDNSARKGSTICSSYEVAARLMLPPEAFLTVKPRFIEEVLVRLRDWVRREAVTLFRGYAIDPSVPLPDRAVALSKGILRASDAIAERLAARGPDECEAFMDIVRAHLPPSLIEAAAHRIDTLPEAYRIRVIAARLGAAIVHQEGLAYVDAIPRDRLGAACLDYYRYRVEVDSLAARIADSGLSEADRIVTLLRAGGARAAMMLGEDAHS